MNDTPSLRLAHQPCTLITSAPLADLGSRKLDSSYDVSKNITAVGGVTGDLHEFRITDENTALFTVYEKVASDLTAYGIDDGWIIDSLFQEVDVETGELIFQWRASDHYPVTESMAPIGSFGVKDNAFDFFHINSIDKDAAGNYLISSRYMCGVAHVSASSGDVLWQLGGSRNNFTDLSGGAATNMTWQHHAAWAEADNTLTIFDNGAYNKLATAEYSRGLLIALDRDNMTATLLQDYVAPQRLLVPSQGSVQQLPGDGNILVGWGHTPAFTEFSADGKALCDVHIGAVHLAWLGRCKNYRTFKSPWVGRPKTRPAAAMRPREDALYVSWNGATEVDRWVLQSGDEPAKGGGDDGGFVEHGSVAREGKFETRIDVPADAGDFVRVAALDGEGEVLGYSEAVSKRVETEIAAMYAPPRPGSQFSIPALVGGCVLGLVALVLLWCCRARLRRPLNWLRWRSVPKAPKYEMLPLNERD